MIHRAKDQHPHKTPELTKDETLSGSGGADDIACLNGQAVNLVGVDNPAPPEEHTSSYKPVSTV